MTNPGRSKYACMAIWLLLTMACYRAALAESAGDISVLVAVQNEADGKPIAAPPMITKIVSLLASESALPLVVKGFPWRRALWMAEQGDGFVYGASATPERLKVYAFSQAVYEVNQWLVVPQQRKFEFAQWDDLKGKVLSIQSGAHFTGEFENLRGKLFTVEENAETIPSRLKMLLQHRMDAMVIDSYRSARQFEARLNCVYGAIGQWAVLPMPVASEPVLLAIGKNSPLRKRLDDINSALERLKQTGGMRKLIDEHAVKPDCS